jgi:hypothetical protein
MCPYPHHCCCHCPCSFRTRLLFNVKKYIVDPKIQNIDFFCFYTATLLCKHSDVWQVNRGLSQCHDSQPPYDPLLAGTQNGPILGSQGPWITEPLDSVRDLWQCSRVELWPPSGMRVVLESTLGVGRSGPGASTNQVSRFDGVGGCCGEAVLVTG